MSAACSQSSNQLAKQLASQVPAAQQNLLCLSTSSHLKHQHYVVHQFQQSTIKAAPYTYQQTLLRNRHCQLQRHNSKLLHGPDWAGCMQRSVAAAAAVCHMTDLYVGVNLCKAKPHTAQLQDGCVFST